MSATKRYLPFPLFLISLAVIGYGIWYTVKISAPPIPQSIGINEVTVAAGTTSLEASPAPTNQTIGQEFTLDINAHSGTDKVTSIKVDLIYDRSKLEVKSFIKTSYLPFEIAPANILDGRITAHFSVPTGDAGKADWGTVAKITIKPIALGKHTIEFNDGTLVTSESLPVNALKTVTPIVINVFNVGDINKNKSVDLLDYNLFVTDYGVSGYSPADLDKSGQVNLQDYKLFVANYGLISP